jgi:hypothetical protein
MRGDEYYNTVHVEDYYDKIHRTTLARRATGAMGAGTLGFIYGIPTGIVAAFMPPLLTALHVAGAAATGPFWPAVAGLLIPGIATFAGVGSFLGMAIGADVGANAGAVAAGLEEMEKRQRAVGIETAPVPSPAAVSEALKNDQLRLPKLFDLRAGLILIPLCAAFGAIIALSPVASVAVALLGFKVGGAAAIISSAAIFGMLGAGFGFKNSLLTNKLGNFYFRLFSGPPPKREVESELPNLPAHRGAAMAEEVSADIDAAPRKSFVADLKRFSPAELAAQREGGMQADVAPSR